MINEVDKFKWPGIRKNNIDIRLELFNDLKGYEVFLTSSGKAAISIVLDFYRESGQLENKNSELWVPKWLGYWVYNIMQKRCFPTIIPSNSTRGVFIYHQYGYPQNLTKILTKARSKNWFIIEDCAHAIMSYSKGKRLGSIGDVGVFSFSKFFPSLMGGAIITKNEGMVKYIEKTIKSKKGWGGNLSFISQMFFDKSNRKNLDSFWGKSQEMCYGVYDFNLLINPIVKKTIANCLYEKALKKRNENRDYYLKELNDLNVLIEINNHDLVTPYVMPVIAPEWKLDILVKKLRNIGVGTGKYHFDVNRDIGDPNFVKCVWLPVHEGLNITTRKLISDSVKSTIYEK